MLVRLEGGDMGVGDIVSLSQDECVFWVGEGERRPDVVMSKSFRSSS